MKIQAGKRQHFITVPKWVMNNEGWRKGDDVNFAKNNKGEITLTIARKN